MPNPWEKYQKPAPSAGTVLSLPPSQHQQAEDGRADQRLSIEQQRFAMEKAKFDQEQRKFHLDNDPLNAPGDTSKTGEEYLKTLPSALANQVRMMADGRMAMPAGAAQRSLQSRMLMAAAAQFDPNMDAANVASRIATRKDFAVGKSAQGITSIQTALGHMQSLWDAAQDLHNGSIPLFNSVGNAIKPQLGDTELGGALAAFNQKRQSVADELTRVFRGTGGSEADIRARLAELDPSMAPTTLRKSISGMVDLLRSRIDALGEQYNRGMSRSSDPVSLLSPEAQAVYTNLSEGGPGAIGITKGNQTPPMIGGMPNSPNPPAGPMGGNGGPGSLPPIPGNGGPSMMLGIATGATRQVPMADTAAGMDALVRAGRPVNEAAAYAQSQGMTGFDPKTYLANVAWAKMHPNYGGSFTAATKTEPVSTFQQIAGGPAGGYASGASSSLTAGYNDELGGLIGSSLGMGNYADIRDNLNARKSILAATNPTADLLGNVTGGAAANILGGRALGAIAPTVPGMFGRLAPVVGDTAYGALYGSGQDNEDRAGGALIGALTAAGAGAGTRVATRAVGRAIAPVAGDAAQLYNAGVFPTPGQRFANSGWLGRAANTAEQAMQSFPGLGAMVASSRQGARDAFQRGGFNQALSELGQQLPEDIGIGTNAHAYTKSAFDYAYDTARSGMQFAPDPQYMQEMAKWRADLRKGVLSPSQADQVEGLIQSTVGDRLANQPITNGTRLLDGGQYKASASELGKAADTWASNPNTSIMADPLRDYASIFDSAARRNSTPDAVSLLDNADAGYAKLVRLQNASARGGIKKDAGTFTPTDLLGAVKQEGGGVRSSAYNRGDALMQDYANAGRLLADTLPNSGSADRLLTGQAIAGAGGTAVGAPGAIVAHPLTLAPFAPYVPGVERLTKGMFAPRAITLPPNLSGPINNFGAQIYDRAPDIGRIAAPVALDWRLGR